MHGERRLAARARPLPARGHRHADERDPRRRRQPLVPAPDRVRRAEPVGVRRLRRLPRLGGARTRFRLPEGMRPVTPVGPLGRLGRWTATHGKLVALAWVALALPLALLAPRVEHALSGAGWEASGSESVEARALVEREFQGPSSSALTVVLHSQEHRAGDPEFRQALSRVGDLLRDHEYVAAVVQPRPGVSISRDGHTAIVQAGAAGNPTEMVRAADELKGELAAVGGAGVEVALTGASGLWSDFNTANREAMMKSELISWPVTLAILVLAFGSLVAAGLPLMLTILGLVAAAGSLFLAAQVADVSIWAMNFALALGIDYALFVVHRFRGALFGSKLTPVEAVAVAMDTAGKAVLFSGLTV